LLRKKGVQVKRTFQRDN